MAKSLLNRVRVSSLANGIHDNVVIVDVDAKRRKKNDGTYIKKQLFIKFAQLDEETGRKVKEIEVSWWDFDHTSEYLNTNLREFCLQIHNLVAVALDSEEEAYKVFETVFDEYATSLEELENKKWKKKELDAVSEALRTIVVDTIAEKIGMNGVKLRLKLSPDQNGEGADIPKYGKFVESMETDETELKFSSTELKYKSKQGNLGNTNTLKSLI